MKMKILQYDYILKALDLPTIEWNQYFSNTNIPSGKLWSIKVEESPGKTSETMVEVKQKKSFVRFMKDRRWIQSQKTNGLIGVDAVAANTFGQKKIKQIRPSKQVIIYYPYYTVVKSGIIDINRQRIVLEGTKGDIDQMVVHNEICVTMIFGDDSLDITGNEHFFTQDEVLPLIDYAKHVRKVANKDLERNKNIQLYFSYVYETNELLQVEGESRLIFYKFKLF